MNIQILPPIFKRIGLLLFLMGLLIPLLSGLLNPYQNNEVVSLLAPYDRLLGTLFLIGIILYFLSKEQVEDELIKKLRLESFSVAFLITAFGLFCLYLIDTNDSISINTTWLLTGQVSLFLLIYHFKKRNFAV